MSNDNYIICRWRDAITDPPPDGWRGLARHMYSYGFGSVFPVFCESGEYTDDDGDVIMDVDSQWLDITTIPAVAVARVQAAVDSIKTGLAKCGCGHGECLTCYLRMDHGEVIDDVVSDTLGRIRHFTGVTPSEVQ